MYRWIVFVHVLAAMTFFLAHGASTAVTFKLRSEKDPQHIRALLDLSGHTIPIFSVSLLVLLVAGIVAGFMGKWWGSAWIWISLALLVSSAAWMSIYSRRQFAPLRKAAGMEYWEGGPQPAGEPLSDEEIVALAAAVSPTWPMLIGYVLPMVILWLMMFKPF